ncbi:MAG: dockerin type I domain-containing protein [Candidatus Zixiibacteriota bacterium]
MAGACINCDTTSYCEPDNPRITILTNPTCVRWDHDFELCAKVIDSDTPPESLTVKLFYRLETNVAYTELLLGMENDSVWCGTIPGSVIDCDDDTIYAYVTASDDRVTVTSPAGAPTTVLKIPVCPNLPPLCEDPSDTTIVFCEGEEVCLPVGCSDPDGNLLGGPVQVFGPGAIANGLWCYSPKISEKVLVGFVCNDSCGIKDCEADFEVTFVLNEAPVCSLTTTPVPPVCVPPVHILNYVSVDPNGDPLDCTNTNPNATLDNGVWQYSPAPGETVFDTIRCEDPCGNICEIPIEITFPNPQPVTCDFSGKDTTIELCVAAPDSIAISSSISTQCSIVSGPGVIRNGYWVYTPTGDQTVIVDFQCIGVCDTCEGRFTVHYEINEPPVCEARADTSIFLCEPGEICIPIYGTDPDGNLVSCDVVSTSVIGRIQTTPVPQWCYQATTDEILSVVTRCVDECGAECLDTFQVTIDVNEAPVCEAHNDTTIFLCEPAQVCIDLKATDADGNLSHCYPAGTLHDEGRTIEAWCFYAEHDTTVLAVGRCVDACGAFCEDTFRVTFVLNDAPECTLPKDTAIFLCEIAPVSLPAFAVDANGNLDRCYIVEGPGVLENGYWTYTPSGDETVTVIVACEDSCKAQCRGVFTVTFNVNEPPSCEARADTSIFLCQPAEICIPIYGFDPDGNLDKCEVVSTSVVGRMQTIPGPQWCYQATVDEILSVVTRCVDSCGAECVDTFQVTIDVNEAPVCEKQADTSIFLCQPQTVCIPLGATDTDGNFLYCYGIGPAGARTEGDPNQYCFFADRDTTFWAHFVCIDQCQAACEDSFQVTVELNDEPVCVLPSDTTIYLCEADTVKLPLFATDENGNLDSCRLVEGPGELVDGHWVFYPTHDGKANVVIACIDSCGAECRGAFSVTFDINEKPVCEVPTGELYFFLCEPQEICFPVSCTDADGNLMEGSPAISSGPGAIANGQWCYTPPNRDTIVVVGILCTDSCGETSECFFTVKFDVNEPPVCQTPNDTTIFLCEPGLVCIPLSATDADNNFAYCYGGLPDPGRTESGSEWCYYADRDTTVWAYQTCVDQCGATCIDSFQVTFDLNEGPACTVPNDTSYLLCDTATICFDWQAIDPDGNMTVGVAILQEITPTAFAVPDTFAGSFCQFFDKSGLWMLTIYSQDSCGEICADTMRFDVTVQDPPVCHVPADLDTILCEPGTIRLPYEPVGDTCYIVSGPGKLIEGVWVYDVTDDIKSEVVIRCENECGTCEDTFQVEIRINEAPICDAGPDTTIFLCDTATVCFDFLATDPDGNMKFGVAVFAPVDPVANAVPDTFAGTFCIPFDKSGHWRLTLYVDDSCGLICQDTADIFVTVQRPPVCYAPADIDTILCQPGSIRLPYESTGDTCYVVSGPGKLEDNAWVYDATENVKSDVIVRCENDCGFCEDTFSVEIRLNEAPICSLPNDTTYYFCDPDTLCLPFEILEPDGNLAFGVVVLQPIAPQANAKPDTFTGELCIPVLSDGRFRLTAYAIDSCGVECVDTAFFDVFVNSPPVCNIPELGPPIPACVPDTFVYPLSPSDIDGDSVYCVIVDGPGEIVDGAWVYDVIGGETIAVTIRCYDVPCGDSCESSFELTFPNPNPAVCNVPNDTLLEICQIDSIFIPVLATGECEVTSDHGFLDGGYWRYYASVDEAFWVVIECRDACDSTCVDSFHVRIDINETPVCKTWNDTTIYICDTATICIPFHSTDADSNLQRCVIDVWENEGDKRFGEMTGEVCIFAYKDEWYTAVVTCRDTCGNICADTVQIYVVANKPPVITCPPPLVFECDLVGDFGLATAVDPEGGPIGLTFDQDSIPGECPQAYTLIRTWIATDSCGVADTCEQVIEVKDTTPPALLCDQSGTVDRVSRYRVLGSDPDTCQASNVSDHFTLVFDSVVYDNLFDRSTWYYNLTWDGVPPGLSHLTIQLCEEIDSSDVISSSPSGANVGKDGSTDLWGIKWTPANFPANTPVPFSFTLNDQYAIGPTVFVPKAGQNADIVGICGPSCDTFPGGPDPEPPPPVSCTDTLDIEPPPAIDNCDPNPVVTEIDRDTIPGQCAYAYFLTVTWEAVDACGNADTCSRTFEVRDTTAPVIACPADTIKHACDTEIKLVPPTAEDNCDPEPLVTLLYDSTFYNTEVCTYTYTRLVAWVATDDCGNADTCVQVIQTYDDQEPVCTVPSDTTFFICQPGEQICLPVTAEDNCDDSVLCVSSVTSSKLSEPVAIGILDGLWCWTAEETDELTVAVTCVDHCGNTCTRTFLVSITVNTPPVCEGPEDTTIVLCQPAEICLPISATDVDGNFYGCFLFTPDQGEDRSTGGELPVDEWCYYATGDTSITVYFVCVDSCKTRCVDSFKVDISVNEGPVCQVPNDTSIFLCDTATICLPYGGTDPDGTAPRCYVVGDEQRAQGGDEWCWFADRDTVLDVVIRCEDDCGAFCEDTFRVSIDMNEAPVCITPNDTTIFLCEAQELCFPISGADADGNLEFCGGSFGGSHRTSGLEPGGQFCYYPAQDTSFTVYTYCVDSCGAVCEDSFKVDVRFNRPPVCGLPNDTSLFLCDTMTFCIPYFFDDPDGNLYGGSEDRSGITVSRSGAVERTANGLESDTICIPLYESDVWTVILIVTDSCGALCSDTMTINVQLNEPPVCEFPSDTSLFVCEEGRITLPFETTGDTCLVTEGPGWIEDATWNYNATHDTSFAVSIRCEDSCGAYCEGKFTVTIDVNTPPVVIPLPDQEFKLCEADTICIGPWPKIDEDDNWVRNFAPFGFLDAPFVCFVPDTAGIYTVILCIEDECGAVACDTVLVKVTFNQPPVCEAPKDTTIFLCAPERVCLPINSSDPDGDFTFCKTYIGPPDARIEGEGCKGDCPKDLWCYTPQGDEVVHVLVVCTDSCGNYCEAEFTVTFVINDEPVCDLPGDTTIFLCEEGEVSLPVSAIDLDGNLKECRVVEGGGAIVDGFWVYYASVAETLSVVVACEDSCGAECRGQFEVIFEANQPPICEFGEVSPPQCVPAQLVVPIFSTDPEGGTVVCSLVDGPGEVIDNVWQWEPIPGVTDTVYIECADSCGATCQIDFVVSIPNPQPPTCVVPVEDQSFFLCAPALIDLDVYAIAGDDDSVTCEIIDGPGSLANGKWTYNATTTESFDVTVRCTNQCGAYCEETFTVDIRINSAPVCELPGDQQIFQCDPAKILLPFSVIDVDGNLHGCEIVSGPGTLVDGNWSYTPAGPGDFSVTIVCYDSCEASCEGTFFVQVRINEQPRCIVPNDTTIAQCTPTQVALPVSAIFYEPDFGKVDDRGGRSLRIPGRPVSKRERDVRQNNMNNLAAGVTQDCQVVAGPGFISNGYWYYTPTGDQNVCVTVRCTDGCGDYCEETFCVNFVINDAPVCSFQAPSPGQCTPAIIAVPFTSTDPEGGPLECEIISGPGTLNDHVWQYEPVGGESFAVKIRCTDTCGAYCDIDFNINVPNPQPPICVLPTTTVNRFLCGPGQITVPVSSTGGTGAVNCQVISGPGQIVGGNWVLNVTQPGQYSVTVQCTDACGETCQGTFNVNVTFNSGPTCEVPDFINIRGCEGAEATAPVSAFDPDGNLVGCEVYSGPGEIIDGEWVWDANSEGEYEVTVRCYDECGAECYGSFYVSIDLNEPPVCNIEGNYYFQGCDDVKAQIPINAYDPDGNLKRCVKKTGIGTLVNGVWTYTASTSGTHSIQIECTDSCGASSLCEFSVTFDLNDPPICNFNDTTIVVCGAGDIVVPLPSFDTDGNLAGCTLLSGPGSIIGHEWYYHLLEDTPVELLIRCVDECGMECVSTWVINFEFGDVLNCDFNMPDTVFMCGPGEFCLDIPPGCEVAVGLAKVEGVTMCFEATEEGTYWADITCGDACGNECTRRASFEVVFTDLPDCGPTIVSGRTTEPGVTPQAAEAEPCDCPVRGDLSGEGEVTALDVSLLTALLQQEGISAAFRQDPNCPIEGRADVNCDGAVNMRDVQELADYIFHRGKMPCGRCTRIGEPVVPRDR